MLPTYFGEAKFWLLLLRFDEDLAAEVQAAGCPHCGGRLHAAPYPRKPRGIARALLGPAYERRLSFCCAGTACRRRSTPPSVRFFGRRVYLGAWVVLISALSQGRTGKCQSQLCLSLGLSARTLRRWRQWWREGFAITAWWREAGASFVPALDIAELPSALLERFKVPEPAAQLLAALCFIAPLSVGSQQAG